MTEDSNIREQLDAVSSEQPDLLGNFPDGERPVERQYCIFRAGRERFCLSVLEVEEVVEWPSVTRMPLAPSFLMGVFNLRGSIVPVVDIAFTEGRRPALPPKHVVVASLAGDEAHDGVRVGIAAGGVFG